MQVKIQDKLTKLQKNFMNSLCEEDDYFMENMKSKNLAGDAIERYRYWEWPQGVGLYGLWKLFETTQDTAVLDELENFYLARLEEGLPSKNINTCAPLLALSFLYEARPKPMYRNILLEWAEWIMNELPKTHGGGFQHITSDSVNSGELWDDTLFMTVLVLLRCGEIFIKPAYVEEAVYQFMIHSLYLMDRTSGLWFHGFTFEGHHHFAAALWARGNSWITIALPYLLSRDVLSNAERRIFSYIYKEQVDGLLQYQDQGTGMWHTLIDDGDSYLEASGSAGIAYGILEAVKIGVLDESYLAYAKKPLQYLLDCVDEEGVVHQVSYGTPMGREEQSFYKEIPLQPMPYGTSMTMLYLIGLLD